MRQVLQLLSLLLVLIAVTVAWRITQVAGVRPPVFPPPPQIAVEGPDLPRLALARPNNAVINSIVDGNIFEEERGFQAAEDAPQVVTALPPPTNVVLNGIMVLGGETIAIMTDTKQGGNQLTLRAGQMVDVYEVGTIDTSAVTLLGPGGQSFAVALDLKKAAPERAAPARPTPTARTTPTRTTPASRATTRSTPARPTPTRATNPRSATPRPVQPAAATTRGAGARPRPAPARPPQQEDTTPDPAQARLEALKQLRAASAN